MEEYAIDIQHFTKDYGMGKGVFNVTLPVWNMQNRYILTLNLDSSQTI